MRPTPTAAGSAAPFFVTTPVDKQQSESITPQSLMEVSGLAKVSDGITPAVGSTLEQQQGVARTSAHYAGVTLAGACCARVTAGERASSENEKVAARSTDLGDADLLLYGRVAPITKYGTSLGAVFGAKSRYDIEVRASARRAGYRLDFRR